MKVFVAGASGVLGRVLIPPLVARGHEVVGLTRSPAKQELVGSLGASPVVADALDAEAVAEAVAAAKPEVIVHELTALSGPTSLGEARHPERSPLFRTTDRLRTEGTDNLLAAGRAAGARRFVAQSFAAFRFADSAKPILSEEELAAAGPARVRQPGLEGILHVEAAVSAIDWGDGLVLRYGGFYGPGTAISAAADAPIGGLVRRRLFPVIGDGGGYTSHLHVEDAAAATVAAVEGGGPGIYNIVDDEPAAAREWLPALAAALGAKPPRHIPRWLGRLAAGELATAIMTEAKGASNAKAKAELELVLRYPSWRQGFRAGLT